MGKKNKGSNAKRAEKKHQKEVARRKAVATVGKRVAAEPRSRGPDELWKPATEGIEGFATRLHQSVHIAARVADHLVLHHGRADAAGLALPSRIRGLSTEQILAGLSGLGVGVDEAAFRALAERHESARRLARDEWFPRLPERSTVHQRDFLSQAAVELWARWGTGLVSDEAIADRLDDADRLADDEEELLALRHVLATWEEVQRHGGWERLKRAGLDREFPSILMWTLPGIQRDDATADLLDRAADVLRGVADHLTDDELRDDVKDAADDVDWEAGRKSSVLERLIEEAEDARGSEFAALDRVMDDGTPEAAACLREVVARALESAGEERKGSLREVLEALDQEMAAIAGE